MKITSEITMTRDELNATAEAIGLYGDELMKYPSSLSHGMANAITMMLNSLGKDIAILDSGIDHNKRVCIKVANKLQAVMYKMQLTDKITMTVEVEFTEEASSVHRELFVEVAQFMGRMTGAVLSFSENTRMIELFKRLVSLSNSANSTPICEESHYKLDADGNEIELESKEEPAAAVDNELADNGGIKLSGSEVPMVMVHRSRGKDVYYSVMADVNDKNEMVVDGVVRGKVARKSAHTVTGDFEEYNVVHVTTLPFSVYYIKGGSTYKDAVESVLKYQRNLK